MCLVGSGHSWNFWHQWFDGGAVLLRYCRPLMIGTRWGTKVADGATSATLSFQLSKGAASIGGSTQVKNYGTHVGDTGEEFPVRDGDTGPGDLRRSLVSGWF